MTTALRQTRTKRPEETASIPFDFGTVLVEGTTIQGAPVVTLAAGLEQVGVVTSGNIVTVQLRSGVAGDDYLAHVKITASNGDVHALDCVVLVRDEN